MDASFENVDGSYTLGFERRLAHAPEKVWRMLTERALIKQWFPTDIEGEWTVGAPLRFTFLNGEGEGVPDEDMRGKVLTVDAPTLLEFTWGKHFIRAEVVADGDGSTLIFSATVDDPTFGARDASGWEMSLENLESMLQGAAALKFAWENWLPKFRRYVGKYEPTFGPQAEPPGLPQAEG
jgi:uncharacterized protein YndB with AHSA1/START domain